MTTPIPSNSITAFRQTTAPVGWTKLTIYDDISIRLSSTGGTAVTDRQSFTTVFSVRTIRGNNASVYTVSPATAGFAPHSHPFTRGGTSVAAGLVSPAPAPTVSIRSFASPTTVTSNPAGGGGAHTHAYTGDYFADATWNGINDEIDFSVQYVDLIIAQRD